MKILISAYACAPHAGSEPGIGWNWVTQATRFNDVWVLTHSRNQQRIEAELAANPRPNLHVAYHTQPRNRAVIRGVLTEYHAWQLTALSTAKRLQQEVGFDLAHHVTFGGVRYPTFLARLGVPYVFGPIGGLERGPRSFYPSFGLRGAVWELVRDGTGALISLNPPVRASYRNASRILVTSRQTLDALPSWARDKASVMSQIAVHASGRPLDRPRRDPERFNVLYTGRLLPWKGLRLAVKAFAKFHGTHRRARFTILGDGPDSEYLKKLADRLGVAGSVDFKGRLPHVEAMELYRTHDAFLFPCFHLSGVAVLEAMDAGLPVVSLDIGDAADYVTDETGIRVPVGSPAQVVDDLAAALSRLALDDSLVCSMGEAGHERVAALYDWDRKGEAMRDLYAEVAAGR